MISTAIEKECPQANFRPLIGVCEVEAGETDAAMLCNNAQIAADAVRGQEGKRIRRFDHTMMRAHPTQTAFDRGHEKGTSG